MKTAALIMLLIISPSLAASMAHAQDSLQNSETPTQQVQHNTDIVHAGCVQTPSENWESTVDKKTAQACLDRAKTFFERNPVAQDISEQDLLQYRIGLIANICAERENLYNQEQCIRYAVREAQKNYAQNKHDFTTLFLSCYDNSILHPKARPECLLKKLNAFVGRSAQ